MVTEQHFAKFPAPQRAALLKTRAAIARILPGAEDALSWGMPTFRIDGIAVVSIEGFAKHNSLFPHSSEVVRMIGVEHPEITVTKGTVHFPRDTPFPSALLRKVLVLRVAEINDSFPRKNGDTRAFYDNGRLKMRGRTKDGLMHGQWSWWRRDGSLMRTGAFTRGEQSGTWTTYDRAERAVKQTQY